MWYCKYNVNHDRNYVITQISFEITWNTSQLCQKPVGFLVSPVEVGCSIAFLDVLVVQDILTLLHCRLG